MMSTTKMYRVPCRDLLQKTDLIPAQKIQFFREFLLYWLGVRMLDALRSSRDRRQHQPSIVF